MQLANQSALQSIRGTISLRSDPEKIEGIPASRWETVMPGYAARVDEPASYYWKQLSNAFPKALVISSVRDPDSWWAAMATLEEHFDEELRRPELITPERREFRKFVDAIYAHLQSGPSEDVERAFFESHEVMHHSAKRDANGRRRFSIVRNSRKLPAIWPSRTARSAPPGRGRDTDGRGTRSTPAAR